MSFVAPLYLVAAGMGAAGVVVLHYIVMRQPPRDVLPTARFVPLRPAVVRTWARRPEDLLLLALRTLAILLVGVAFARPVWHRHRVSLARIVLADRSRDVGDATEVSDSARRLVTGAPDTLISFYSTSHGNISAALIDGFRAATRARTFAESVEVVLVSPALIAETDAATDSIRAQWPGAVRWVPVTARHDSGATVARATIRWPDSTVARSHMDTASAVVTAGAVVVASFARRWAVDTSRGVVVARWVDGEPAAVERAVSGGCERRVVVPVPVEGDLTLRPEFVRFDHAMRAPCGMADRRAGGTWRVDSVRPSRIAAGTVPGNVNLLISWLIGIAVVLLLVELGLRRR